MLFYAYVYTYTYAFLCFVVKHNTAFYIKTAVVAIDSYKKSSFNFIILFSPCNVTIVIHVFSGEIPYNHIKLFLKITIYFKFYQFLCQREKS